MNLAKAIPTFSFSITVPTRPADIARRYFNSMAKEALRETLGLHHMIHLPRHFFHSARARYGYKPRKQTWVLHKMREWGQDGADLVATGMSKRRILNEQPQIVIGGAAEGGKKGLEGKMTVRFSFNEKVKQQQAEKYAAKKRGFYERKPQRERKAPTAEVKLADMKREIRAMTDDERRKLAATFRDSLMAKMASFREQRRQLNETIVI
jgi:hypothetical protein